MADDMRPDWEDGLPICTEDKCPQYDGKRCRAVGWRPDRFCEPALKELSAAAVAAERQRCVALIRARAEEWKAEAIQNEAENLRYLAASLKDFRRAACELAALIKGIEWDGTAAALIEGTDAPKSNPPDAPEGVAGVVDVKDSTDG